jgi:hypothetical protein
MLDQLVVSPPALDEPPPAVAKLFTRQTLATAPFLPHLCFESLQTFRRDLNLPLPI